MQREVSDIEARMKFVELLDQAHYSDNQIVIKRSGKPIAALISIQSYQQFMKQRDKRFSLLDRVWSKVPEISEDEVNRDIEDTIAEVRATKSDSLNQT